MTQSDEAKSAGSRPGDDKLPWWQDPPLRRERLASQVALIVTSLPGVGVDTGGTEDLGQMRFMYRRGVILVRDADVERVRRLLGGEGPPEGDAADAFVQDSMFSGVTALQVTNTLEALEIVDRRLGTGVATPDHVFYVCPGDCCPATEPDNPGQDLPYPPVSTEVGCDGAGVVAVVVDTGFLPDLVNPKHRWLAGVTGDPEAYDSAAIGPYTGHGTFVAGMLRCQAPRAEVQVRGFLRHGGAVYESEIVQELYVAVGEAPDIISMSAGATTRHNLPSLGFLVLWEQRLQYLKGTVLVAAAGNDADREPFWPAAFPWAVAVGALDGTGQRAGYSNHGSWVDVYALGSDVVNAFPNGTYVYAEPPRAGQTTVFDREMALWSGTSFATPLVAGLVAARMSRTAESGWTTAQALLGVAAAHARPGVGPVLEPGMGCVDEHVGRCGCPHPCACRSGGCAGHG